MTTAKGCTILFALSVFVAAWLPVFSHPQYLQCSQTLAVGEPLMLAPYTATSSTERTVVVTRGSTVLSGSSLTYVPGETLGIAISNTASAEYIFQASNAAFVNGQCSNTRSQVTAPAQLVMPDSGDVSVFFGWATSGPGPVMISPTVTLTAQSTTTSAPTSAPVATSSAPTAAPVATSSAPTAAPVAADDSMDDMYTSMPTTADDDVYYNATDDYYYNNTNSTDDYTEAPTEAPTESPTEAPTESPTEAPTGMPTEAPTDCHDHRMPPPFPCPPNHHHFWCNNGDSYSHCGAAKNNTQWSCRGQTCCPASHGCCDGEGHCMVCKNNHDQDDDQCHHGKPPKRPCDHGHNGGHQGGHNGGGGWSQPNMQPTWSAPNTQPTCTAPNTAPNTQPTMPTMPSKPTMPNKPSMPNKAPSHDHMPSWSVFSETPRLRKKQSLMQRVENNLHNMMEAFQQRR